MSAHLSHSNLEKKNLMISHATHFLMRKNYKIAKLRKPIFHREIWGRVKFKVLPIFWRQNKIFNITPICTQSKLLPASTMALIIRLLGVQMRQGLHCRPPSCSDLFHLFQQASGEMARVPAMGGGLALPIWAGCCQMASLSPCSCETDKVRQTHPNHNDHNEHLTQHC